nr:hypothetical protein [Tanacetum cinerariifolium]
MQTRSSSKSVSESSSNPISNNTKHRNRRRSKPRVEPFSIPIVTMADNRTMEKMLQAPTEGYGDAIVVPDILAEKFEIRTGLLSLIQANQFHGFENLHFDISFADALILMPIFASTIKSLLANKDKLFELTKIPLNENFLAMLLKKLPKKLGDPADPRVLLILRRSFLRTSCALIDVYGEEITLRVNDEAVTFNLNQTTRYSSTYDDMSVNRIDVIKVARDEYAQEMLELTLRVDDEAITFNVGQTSKYSYNDAESSNQIDVIDVSCEDGVSYDGTPIPPPTSSLLEEVERVPEVTKDMVQPSTENIQPSVAQTQVLIDEPIVAP